MTSRSTSGSPIGITASGSPLLRGHLRGRVAEGRMRKEVARVTGQTFRPHPPTAGGADLVAVCRVQPGRRRAASAVAGPRSSVRRPARPIRRAAAARPRRGIQRFDIFDDFLDDVAAL